MATNEHAAAEAARYPSNHVLATIGRREHAEEAAQELRAAGFQHVEILHGRDALAQVEQEREQKPAIANWWQSLSKSMGDEQKALDVHLDALRQGNSVVMVGVDSYDAADRANAILNRYHPGVITHFGSFTTTNLPTA